MSNNNLINQVHPEMATRGGVDVVMINSDVGDQNRDRDPNSDTLGTSASAYNNTSYSSYNDNKVANVSAPSSQKLSLKNVSFVDDETNTHNQGGHSRKISPSFNLDDRLNGDNVSDIKLTAKPISSSSKISVKGNRSVVPITVADEADVRSRPIAVPALPVPTVALVILNDDRSPTLSPRGRAQARARADNDETMLLLNNLKASVQSSKIKSLSSKSSTF